MPSQNQMKIRFTSHQYSTVKPINCSLEEAVTLLGIFPDLFEITNNDYDGDSSEYYARVGLNRVYGDIDMKVSSKGDMEALDVLFEKLLREALSAFKFSLMCSSGQVAGGVWKVSWRFVLCEYAAQKCVILEMFTDAEVGLEHRLRGLYKDLGGEQIAPWTASTLDKGVYTVNRKMRCCNSNKDKENRPLRLIHGTLEDTLITYLPEGINTLPYKEKPQQERLGKDRSTKLLEEGEEMPAKQWEFMKELVELIPLSILDKRESWLTFVFACWNEEKTDRMEELIDEISKKSQAWGRGGVREALNSYKTRAGGKVVTKGTLMYWAQTHDKKGYLALLKKHPQELYKQLFSKDLRPPNIQEYDARLVTELPIDAYDTLILESQLGTGKTVQIMGSKQHGVEGILKQYKRILFISGRKSFTAFALAELSREGMAFENYSTTQIQVLASIDRLFIQVESLWRLADGLKRYGGYNLVVIDESETIAHQFYSVETHKDRMIDNHYIFRKVVEGATKVVAADAFVSDRTFNMLRLLRESTWAERTLYILNKHQPYKRSAIELLSPENDKRVPNVGLFIQRILEAIAAKKRIVIVWTSLRKGNSFNAEYLQPLIEKQGLKVKFYNGSSGKTLRSELDNVGKAWSAAECDVLMYTTSITVGISFNPEDLAEQYEELFLWASAGSATPRDVAQALLRCRKIKSNKLTYVCDLRGVMPVLAGLEQVRMALREKKERLRIDHPMVAWREAPQWADDNYAYNENEVRISRSEYRNVLKHYLYWCGYTVIMEGGQSDYKLTNADGEDFDDIANITAEKAEDIRLRKMRDNTEPMEVIKLKKFTFIKQLKCRSTAKQLWNEWLESPKNVAAFWNTVHEKHTLLSDDVDKEGRERYIVMTKREVEKRNTLGKLLKLLNMKHSQENKILAHADMLALLPQAKGLEEEVRTVFGLKSRRANKAVFGAAEFHDMVRSVWGSWCCGKVETVNGHKITVEKKRMNVYDYCFVPNGLWDYITDREEKVDLKKCLIE